MCFLKSCFFQGITHIVNVTLNCPNHFPDRIKYMSIRLDDELSVDLMSWLPKTSKFIADAIGEYVAILIAQFFILRLSNDICKQTLISIY